MSMLDDNINMDIKETIFVFRLISSLKYETNRDFWKV